MIMFNGWLHILEGTSGEEEREETIAVVEKVKNLINPLNRSNEFFHLSSNNGEFMLHIGGSHNHDVRYSEELKYLVQKIGQVAPGSYGLLYIRLPEDQQYWNEYLVYKLAKGKLTIEQDTLLSPCNPVIED